MDKFKADKSGCEQEYSKSGFISQKEYYIKYNIKVLTYTFYKLALRVPFMELPARVFLTTYEPVYTAPSCNTKPHLRSAPPIPNYLTTIY